MATPESPQADWVVAKVNIIFLKLLKLNKKVFFVKVGIKDRTQIRGIYRNYGDNIGVVQSFYKHGFI